MVRSKAPLLIGSALVLALALGGCGRRGPLEPPPGSLEAQQAAAEEKGETLSNVTIPPVGKGASRKTPPIRAPKEPFILDPLL
ncbi:lipoprotein [Rhizobiales bacterium TNE-4]|nr:lipoprotein [Rhizobiales bacterium TNE-4]MBV1828181.1 lipoprotein [Rhizobiales bacterium TNE-4]